MKAHAAVRTRRGPGRPRNSERAAALAPVNGTEAAPAAAEEAIGVRTFTLPARDDFGAIAWDAMTEAKLERLATMAADPEFTRRTGLRLVKGNAPDAPPPIDPTLCGAIYDALATVAITFARLKGFHPAALVVLRFSEEEKAVLAGPTAAVLAKYGGDFKYQDEATLALVVLSIVSGKIALLTKAEEAARATPAAS